MTSQPPNRGIGCGVFTRYRFGAAYDDCSLTTARSAHNWSDPAITGPVTNGTSLSVTLNRIGDWLQILLRSCIRG